MYNLIQQNREKQRGERNNQARKETKWKEWLGVGGQINESNQESNGLSDMLQFIPSWASILNIKQILGHIPAQQCVKVAEV